MLDKGSVSMSHKSLPQNIQNTGLIEYGPVFPAGRMALSISHFA